MRAAEGAGLLPLTDPALLAVRPLPPAFLHRLGMSENQNQGWNRLPLFGDLRTGKADCAAGSPERPEARPLSSPPLPRNDTGTQFVGSFEQPPNWSCHPSRVFRPSRSKVIAANDPVISQRSRAARRELVLSWRPLRVDHFLRECFSRHEAMGASSELVK